MMRILGFAMFLMCSCFANAQTNFYKFKSEIDDELAHDTLPGEYLLSAVSYSMIGEYKASLDAWDYPGKMVKVSPLTATMVRHFSAYKPRRASQYIVEQAGKTSVLIINEAHHQPHHRVFTESLLADLYQSGYRYFGIETMDYRDSLINARKYPSQASGYYSNEPCFGNLIRSALQLGYIVFPYEADRAANGSMREMEQANRIKSFMDRNRKGKYLIFCGYNHTNEDTSPKEWKRSMAGHLKTLTGIDPLTVDQVQLAETSHPNFDNPCRKLMNVDYPAVFADSADHVWQETNNPKAFDLNVYFPDTKYINERPDWLYRSNYEPYKIASRITIDFPCLVLAYVKSEGRHGVPVDVIAINSRNSQKCLILPDKEDVVVVCKNQKGQEQMIEIRPKP